MEKMTGIIFVLLGSDISIENGGSVPSKGTRMRGGSENSEGIIAEHIEFLKLKGRDERTIANIVSHLRTFSGYLASENICFKNVTTDDIARYQVWLLPRYAVSTVLQNFLETFSYFCGPQSV